MDNKLTTAIIGAGLIAGGYDQDRKPGEPGVYSHAGAYTKDGRFDLALVCDVDPHKASAFRDRWKVAAATSRLDDVLGARHDVISVCTPDNTHYPVIEALLRNRACRTIFAEKPLAGTREEIGRLQQAADDAGIQIVVDYQRRFDPAHDRLRDRICSDRAGLLAVNGCYMKGLEHNGIALVDALTHLCGSPRSVLAYDRSFNKAVNEHSYEFVLYFDDRNATIKTIDRDGAPYYYHIFEIDLLFSDRRVTINDNSRSLETRLVGEYAYPGVQALDDAHPVREETGYRSALSVAVDYLHAITAGGRRHTVNTLRSSLMNRRVLDAVKTSYERRARIDIGES